MILSFILAFWIGSIIGAIVTRIYIRGAIVGTIHIDQDYENIGETYRFSFDDFDKIRKNKIVRIKIEDHTTR